MELRPSYQKPPVSLVMDFTFKGGNQANDDYVGSVFRLLSALCLCRSETYYSTIHMTICKHEPDLLGKLVYLCFVDQDTENQTKPSDRLPECARMFGARPEHSIAARIIWSAP